MTNHLMAALLGAACTLHLNAQPTAFTYQGRLDDNGNPASGIYDLKFTIYDVPTSGLAISVLTNAATTVTDGLFSVTLDFGPGVFDGDDRWLEIGVRTNGPGSPGFNTLNPRQPITATPYALHANSAAATAAVPWSGISGMPSGFADGTDDDTLYGADPGLSLNGTNFGLDAAFTDARYVLKGGDAMAGDLEVPNITVPGSVFAPMLRSPDGYLLTLSSASDIELQMDRNNSPGVVAYYEIFNGAGNQVFWVNEFGNGQIYGNLTVNGNISAGTLLGSGAGLSDLWRLGGNTGTTPGVHFLGTSDNQPLELKVNNTRALLLEPSFFSPRLIGGHPNNAVAPDADGAVIAGGGSVDRPNFAGAGYTFIGSGVGNTNHGGAGFIGGGLRNLIESEAYHSVVAGGLDNTISSNAFRTVIGGGDWNRIGTGAHFSSISGGQSNSIANGSLASAIDGGRYNHIGLNSGFCSIGGGLLNTIADEAIGACIPGGTECFAASYALAAGRSAKANHVGAFVWADSSPSEFASSGFNQFLVRALGGVGINKTNPATALDVNGTVTATGFAGAGSGLTLLNAANLASGTLPDARLSGNVALRNQNNTFSANQSFSTGTATAPGLSLNGDADTGVFSPGANNLALATGGAERLRVTSAGQVGVGTDTPAAPLHVHTPINVDVSLRLTSGGSWPLILNQSGSSVFSITNGGQGQLFIPASGNVGVGTNNPAQRLHVVGNILATGTITGSSDRNVKEDFAPVDARVVLEKVAALPIQRWNYIGERVPHVGPMAQDFYAAFGVGADDKHISMVDADGVALAAIQGLNEKVDGRMQNAEVRTGELERKLERKEAEITELKQRLDALERIVLCQKPN